MSTRVRRNREQQVCLVLRIGSFIYEDLCRQKLLVDQEAKDVHQGRWLFFRNADLLLSIRIQNIVGIGQLQESNVFFDEVGIAVKHTEVTLLML